MGGVASAAPHYETFAMEQGPSVPYPTGRRKRRLLEGMKHRGLLLPWGNPAPRPISDFSHWLSPRINKKMSDAQGSYKLDEAQAVLRETKAIKKAITCGEKEKQDLIKVREFRDTGPTSISPTHLCLDSWTLSTCYTDHRVLTSYLELSASFYRRKGGSEASSNLPKATQLM